MNFPKYAKAIAESRTTPERLVYLTYGKAGREITSQDKLDTIIRGMANEDEDIRDLRPRIEILERYI